MRAVVQRVKSSEVTVDGNITGKIGKGLTVLIGVENGDTESDVMYIAKKVARLRVFDDENGVMNLSASDIGAPVLAVSQFTLLGDCRNGNRPSYTAAGRPEDAKEFYDMTVNALRNDFGLTVEEGIYRADMLVKIENDGPVTILLDSRKNF